MNCKLGLEMKSCLKYKNIILRLDESGDDEINKNHNIHEVEDLPRANWQSSRIDR